MEKLVVESPAKINLGLNVVRKRVDGFHDLETIFVPLMLSDIIRFKKADKFRFESNSELLNQEKENLILRAIKLIEEKTRINISLHIDLEKNIPIGGGLGGGSSNAATTLKTINKMFKLGLNYNELAKLALKLGSDVPYFLNPVSAYAESRGEVLTLLNLEISYPILLVNPAIKIDTKWAFGNIKPATPERNLKEIFKDGLTDFDTIKNYVRNDFEDVVFEEYPEIKQIKSDLYKQGAQFALMSGTGSTVYGIFSNLQKATWAKEYFSKKYFTYLNNPFIKGSIT
jgi:4-diphosphocytidyl-2-C-methyl-D-erythritol kinase